VFSKKQAETLSPLFSSKGQPKNLKQFAHVQKELVSFSRLSKQNIYLVTHSFEGID
jgi:hypothetical protein